MTSPSVPTGREAAHGQAAEDPKLAQSRTATDDAPGAEARNVQTPPARRSSPGRTSAKRWP